MIHKISFSNFFSFMDEVSIDFVVDNHAPDTNAYFTDSFGNRISKIMTVVGGNASGKTNLLRSVAFLRWFIADSFTDLEPTQKISEKDIYQPFLFCEQSGPSTFEITFAIEKEIYKYNLSLNNERVLNEVLSIKKETNYWNKIFTRNYDDQRKEYSVNFAKLDLPSDFEKLVRPNSSVLSSAKQINNPHAVKIVNYFSSIQSSFDEMGAPNKNAYQALYKAAEFYHNKPEIRDKVEKILKSFDLGISKFEIQKFKRADNTEVHLPLSYHKRIDSEKEAMLLMNEESGGTRNLFLLLKDIFAALETGNIVIFDELDNNLHPLMVPEIINLFRSVNHNPHNAQLFFSSHNVQILNELDKQQIVLVEKDKNISDAWKLSDIEGVRPGENYYTKYLAGVYGGIPRL
ncbi:MAG: ATP-binding protein [Candidatus Pacebacteria bacterium]|nr:ATP-binding protein [Candidatus Paceibacterota bacterium]